MKSRLSFLDKRSVIKSALLLKTKNIDTDSKYRDYVKRICFWHNEKQIFDALGLFDLALSCGEKREASRVFYKLIK